MRTMMKRIAMAALAASGLALLAVPAQAQRNGLYQVNGTNPDGSAYTGQMLIQQVGLASWRVAWQIGENRFEGYGMSAGPVFSIGFTLGQSPGIAIYQVTSDGGMTGQWTIVGSSAIGTENLTPVEAPPARTAPQAPPAAAPTRPRP
ncbi:hypothetical protein J8J14_02895 [Roseomonas sp. SSH11]|uniref:Fibronectin attachment protein n=1 Tax=Pararoseomonas baculiformis TaxID=2820812 RepID=A0ABS4A9P7_9PROT|nr:hypothetical protein [Pararoseomonas baculiformis]MBP0443715.1 hypothetical protein [Pararoseomonas baculiformis]